MEHTRTRGLRKLLSAGALAASASLAFGGSFTQGTIEGMPEVLPVNRLTALELAKASDSILFAAANWYLDADVLFWRLGDARAMPVQISAGEYVSLKPLLLSRKIEGAGPGWVQCRPDVAFDRSAGAADPQTPARRKLVSECRHDPAGEAKLTERIDRAQSLVRRVQADVRKATEFALLVPLAVDGRLSSGRGQAKAAKVSDLAAAINVSFGAEGPQADSVRTAAGLAVRIGWGQTMQSDAQLLHCTSGAPYADGSGALAAYSVTHAVTLGLLRNGDPAGVCFALRGLAGASIPTHLIVRDTTQIKAEDNLRLAVVFAPEPGAPKRLMADTGKEGTTIALVGARPAYAQLVDMRSNRAIGGRIAFDAPKTWVRMRASDCLRAGGASLQASDQAMLILGCTSEQLRAALGGRSVAQVSRDELRQIEARLIDAEWAD